MPKLIDLTGKRFGRLTVVSKEASTCQTRWLVLCDCGSERIVQGGNLKSGTSKSCGCFQREQAAIVARTSNSRHGKTNSPEWSSWRAMIKRCEQPSSINYSSYGGRGVKVCERWRGKSGFENFLADMGERPTGTSIDRIDNNGNYEPRNCRWANRSEQARNTSATPKITYEGKEYAPIDLAELLGISTQTIAKRIRDGVPLNLKKWWNRK